MLEEELIIKTIGKLSLMYPEIDQLKVRDMLYEVINNYEITSRETSLVASDIPDRATMYLAVKKLDGLSKKTLYNYKLHLERFASAVVKPLSMITTNDIRVFLAMLSNSKNLKQTSISTEISILKSFFGWLTNEEIIPKNPTAKIKQPKKEKRLRKSLTQEELEMLRDSCITSRQRAILEFLFSTGCRLEEMVNVNVEDIKWDKGEINVIGKGNKERTVYLNAKAKLYLRKYLKEREKIESPALFVASRYPHKRMGGRSIEREINKINQIAGFEKSVYPHLIRHTTATLALKAGMTLTSIQHLLGHEDPGTTQIYAETNSEDVKHEYNKYLNQ